MADAGDGDIDTLLMRLAVRPQQRRPLHLVGTKRFELLRKLGSGGFGDVYEARDREHGTRVALKALRSSDPDWIYRFKREFRVAADLAHPNIARLFELLVEDDRWYLTMELLDGLPLHDYVARAPEQLRASFAQLALGLVELHRAGCLHRDLKPSNVLVEASGRVVLLDFGLALDHRASRMSAVAGTPPYMAPELALRQPPSDRADWYAFGVMLYEVLAGHLPFTGSDIEMLQQKLGPPPPVPGGAQADPALADLALRLLDKNPATRAVADDVFAVLVGDGRTSDVSSTRNESRVVGRSTELATLERALASVQSTPVVVTVRGAPGMGKSSLLTAFEAEVRARGGLVYGGRCREVESVPFKGLDPVIDLLCSDLMWRRYEVTRSLVPADVGALTQMFPMFKRVEAFARARGEAAVRGSPHAIRDAALRAFKELLGKLSASSPLVITLDDLQWAGEDTLHVLGELMRAPGVRCLLVCAHRDDRTPSIEQLEREIASSGVEHTSIEVAPLDGAAVAEWLGDLGGVSVETALRETGGHPYLLSRLIELGSADIDAGQNLMAVLSRELAQLDAHARAALEVIAVAGEPLRASIALEVAGETDGQPSLDHLRRRKLVRRVENHVEPYHDRVREVVVAEASPARRQTLHLELATALERNGLVAPDVLARHFRAGGDRARGFKWTLRAAAHAAETLAFARAVTQYRTAVDLAPDDVERERVYVRLAEALAMGGQMTAASQAYFDAATLARHRDDAAATASHQAQAGEHALLGGEQARGFELLREALADVDVKLPESAATAVAESFNIGGALAAHGLAPRLPARPSPRLARRLDLELAVARSLTQTDLRAPLMACRSLDDALTMGDPRRLQLALALFVLNHAARMPGDSLLVEAEAQAYAIAHELADEVAMAWAQLAAGMHSMYCHDFSTALAELAASERTFTATPGYAREAALGRIGAIVICGNYFVDLPHARARAAGFLEDALARGDLYTATWAMFVQINVEIANGRPSAARALLEGIHATWPLDRDSMLAANVINHRISLALLDEPATAWSEVEATEGEYIQLFSSMIPISVQLHGRLAANCAYAAWLAGRADTALTLERLDRLVAQVAQLSFAGPLMIVESHRHFVRGDRAAQRAALARAAELYTSLQQTPIGLACRYRLQQLEASGDAPAAAADLRAAGCLDPDLFATFIAGPLPPRV